MRRSLPLLLLLAACSENQIVKTDGPIDDVDDGTAPDIEVTPTSINYGDVDVTGADFPAETVTVKNVGDASLSIFDVRLADASQPFTLSAIGNILLAPGEETTFTVTFEPATAIDAATEVLIDSNDVDEPEVPVALTGRGVAPAIAVDPSSYNFGSLYVGCIGEVPLTISNLGNAPLLVSGVTYTTAAPDELSVSFDEAAGPLPWTIAPEASVLVYVDYTALDAAGDEGYVTVASNDPVHPEVQAHQAGTGQLYGENLDTYVQPTNAQADIVFTLDWSGSMSDDIASVQTNFNTFISTLSDMDADYRVSAVVNDDGCVIGVVPYVDSDMQEEDQQAGFDVMVGTTGGAFTEMGFTLIENATSSQNLGPDGCNEGMIRPEARLNIIGVTDEVEQSQHAYDYYVALLRSLKADPDLVKVHAVAGDYPSGCGTAEPGLGWYEASVETGGEFLSICATDWASHLEVLAEGSAANLRAFELTQDPVPDTIVVTVDGVRQTEGWGYEGDGNRVVFDESHVPPGGSTIDIAYALLGDCAE